MNGTTLYKFSAPIASILTLTGLAVWSGGLLYYGGNLTIWLPMLAIGATFLVTAASTWHWRSKRSRAAISRYFNLLCGLDPDELRNPDALTHLPNHYANSFWRNIAAQVGRTLSHMANRIEEVEHVRQATDIRARRATADYQHIRAILESLDDPVIAIDKYDELMLANSSAESLLDIDSKNTEKRALGAVLRCQKLVDLLTNTCHCQAADKRSDEIGIRDDREQEKWFRVTASRLMAESDNEYNPEDGTQGAVAVLRCIDDHKALQRRNAEFVSAVSHEMKTPLAGIKAYVELLADGEDDDRETREEFINVINSQANRLQRLVENLLNLARMEAGVVKVDKQSRPLNEVLEEAVHVVQPSAEAKDIQLTVDLSPMYLGILADRDMLLQAAINLLSNAIKYTSQGGQVTLRSRLVDTEVRFEVEDNGVGLSEEDSTRVFEKFYRVNKNKDMAPGTGLGLPLAKHIAEDVHGGRLEVSSTLGQGSIFSITLPSSGQLSQRPVLTRPQT
ncbi:MAG: PAS domain-containing protein [Pirellulales bacterium]|nr:PAS domain-containing protein [Pirellulales bacterium]